jgi:hypothetical protein
VRVWLGKPIERSAAPVEADLIGDVGGFDMEVLEHHPYGRMRSRVTDAEEWIGTEISCTSASAAVISSSVDARGLARSGRGRAPLQHQICDVPDESKELVETGHGWPVPTCRSYRRADANESWCCTKC